jgi:hypothetical protein
MGGLHAMEAGFGMKVHDILASLLNLEADLLLPARPPRVLRPGTPVRCCPGMRTAAARRPAVRRLAKAGPAARARARDSRPDLPRVVAGVAVTRDGIPGPLLVLAPGTPATPR